MVELSRIVRFFLNGAASEPRPQRHNAFAAWPPARGLGRYYELRVSCAGRVDPVTGYFMNIHEIDEAVRDRVLPHMEALGVSNDTHGLPMGGLMQQLVERLQVPLHGTVRQVSLALSPYHGLAIRSDQMEQMLIREQFEFAAAHRLNVPTLSIDQNRRVFGKCNNPSGHGHNYRLEVVVSVPINVAGSDMPVEDLDALVDEAVIQKFDHKHLNVDVPQFADLNPSVENIAKVIFDMLADPVAKKGAVLNEVSVWETSKTVCTYRGETQSV